MMSKQNGLNLVKAVTNWAITLLIYSAVIFLLNGTYIELAKVVLLTKNGRQKRVNISRRPLGES